MEAPKLIAALGNPGAKYAKTRHNVAWQVMEEVSSRYGLTWSEKFKGLYAKAQIAGETVFFLMPQTFMNLSGQSVAQLANFFKISREEVLVIHDELDLSFGVIHFKKGGGVAGHNGLKSIQEQMGGADFERLRVGISRPEGFMDVSSYVLAPFDQEEQKKMPELVTYVSDALDERLKGSLSEVQALYSKKKSFEKKE